MAINPVTPIILNSSRETHEPMLVDGSQTHPIKTIPVSSDAGQLIDVGSDEGLFAALPNPIPISNIPISADTGNKLVVGSDTGLYVGADKPKIAFLANSGGVAQTIPYNVYQRINCLNNIIYNYGGGYNNAGVNTQFIAPVSGIYLIECSTAFVGAGASRVSTPHINLALSVNATQVKIYTHFEAVRADGFASVNLSAQIQLQAGDVVDFRVLQAASSTGTLTIGNSMHANSISGILLSL